MMLKYIPVLVAIYLYFKYGSKQTMTAYQIPAAATPYLQAFQNAEQRHNLPRGLLVRMAQQESDFNPEAVSHAGAIGLMQIVPKWHPTVNPWNPIESIDYAGQYIRELFDQFGFWDMALAAYNWGPGNLRNHGFDRAPEETVNYVADISADVDFSGVYA